MKNMTGWVIIDWHGYPVLFDHRMPCYWLKKLALRDAKLYGYERVAKVELKISVSKD